MLQTEVSSKMEQHVARYRPFLYQGGQRAATAASPQESAMLPVHLVERAGGGRGCLPSGERITACPSTMAGGRGCGCFTSREHDAPPVHLLGPVVVAIAVSPWESSRPSILWGVRR